MADYGDLCVFVLCRLKSLDLVTMKALDSKVNIIPVIAKADTITKQELHKFKIKVGLSTSDESKKLIYSYYEK